MGYSPVGDGVPDEWPVYMYDTVLFLAAAIDSMLWKGLDLRDGSSLLQALPSPFRQTKLW
jgi:hypothetical protein